MCQFLILNVRFKGIKPERNDGDRRYVKLIENGGWIDADGHGVDVTLDEYIDGARCIFDSTFTPNTIYLYKMSHSVPPFNVGAPVSLENYVFGEYTQIELRQHRTEQVFKND